MDYLRCQVLEFWEQDVEQENTEAKPMNEVQPLRLNRFNGFFNDRNILKTMISRTNSSIKLGITI